MNRKGYMIVKRWLSEKYYWLQKWETEHLPLKPVRPHVAVLIIAATIVVINVINALVRLDAAPAEPEINYSRSQKCAMWIRDGHELVPESGLVDETKKAIGHPDAYVDC